LIYGFIRGFTVLMAKNKTPLTSL